MCQPNWEIMKYFHPGISVIEMGSLSEMSFPLGLSWRIGRCGNEPGLAGFIGSDTLQVVCVSGAVALVFFNQEPANNM